MVEPAQGIDVPCRQWRNPKSVLLKKKKALQNHCPSPMTGESGILIGSQVFGSPLGGLKRRSPPVTPNKPVKRARELADITNAPSLEQVPRLSTDIPTDLSLKSKVRFTSQASFSWISSMGTKDEAAGVAAYVKGTPAVDEADNGIQAAFQKSLMVWMHPNLPFVQLYPRVESKLTAPSWPGFAQCKEVIDSLRTQWCNSFRSVFQQLRAGHCPYFYVCANNVTALFLSAGSGKDSKVVAFLTPTTSGLRQALTKEGIEFSFSAASNSNHAQVPVVPGDSDEALEDESAANSWLNSMGLLTNSAPAKDPKTIIIQQSRKNKIDGQAESIVKVEGPHVQGLFNYLLNCKVLVSTTGVYAGIPPTLLAPNAFDGATLQSLKYKHGTVQDHSGEKSVQMQCLDVSGPILPQNVQALCALLQRSQGNEFKANVSCVESSTAFNNYHSSEPSSSPSVSVATDLVTCREIVCQNGLYHWS